MILRITPYLVHSNVLIPYILSISKGVGGIWEEYMKKSLDTTIPFKQVLVCPLKIREHHYV